MSHTQRTVASLGAVALLGCVLYLGLASLRDSTYSVWYALAAAIAAPLASLLLGVALSRSFVASRDLALPLVITYGAVAVNWVFNLVRWPFLRNTTIVTVVATVLGTAAIISLVSSRSNAQRLKGRCRVAAWVAVVVLSGTAALGAWTLASPASLEVDSLVAYPGDPWRNQLTVKPGDVLSVLVSFRNRGRGIADNLVVGDNLPPFCEVVKDTTTLTNTLHPRQIGLPDGVATGGVRVGDYGPGSNGHVKFKVRVMRDVPRGNHRLQNIGVVKADQTPETWDSSFLVLE